MSPIECSARASLGAPERGEGRRDERDLTLRVGLTHPRVGSALDAAGRSAWSRGRAGKLGDGVTVLVARQVCSAILRKTMRQLEGRRPMLVLVQDMKSVASALDDIKESVG